MTVRTMPLASAGATAAAAQTMPRTQARLAFIDNLRILLVVLVIVHHVAVTYGGEGSWQYMEGRADVITATVLTLFVAINQAFFMGLYFLIAAYFVPRSLEHKGIKLFLKERCQRLGVPLAFQLLIVGPLVSYGLGITIWGFRGSFWSYIELYVKGYQGLDAGPLWFVEALLIFSVIYALWWWRCSSRSQRLKPEGMAPSNAVIAIFALVVGLLTFIVRIWLPVGWLFAPLGFQFPHFAQYISLFAVGSIAYQRGWLSAIAEDANRGRQWGRVVAFLIVLAPVLFVAGGALEGGTQVFRGGLHWQNLVYALWEQFMCVGMVIYLLVWFRRRHNRQGTLARGMSASAYAVYLFHAPILLFIAIGLAGLELHPMLKFALVSLIAVPACFAVGTLISRLPIARRFL